MWRGRPLDLAIDALFYVAYNSSSDHSTVAHCERAQRYADSFAERHDASLLASHRPPIVQLNVPYDDAPPYVPEFWDKVERPPSYTNSTRAVFNDWGYPELARGGAQALQGAGSAVRRRAAPFAVAAC